MGKELAKRSQFHQPKHPPKRQRLDQHSSKPKSKSTQRRPVAIDDLAWKSVTLPDQLEDAEGFYGLEEIEDVAVVRDGGELEYRVGKRRVLILFVIGRRADGDSAVDGGVEGKRDTG